MNSDNVYMINDDGQIVLMPTSQSTSQSTPQSVQKTFNNRSSQINPVIVQNNPVTQPYVRQNNVNRRNIGSIRYTQYVPQPQVSQPQVSQPQQVYQRPQVQKVQQVEQVQQVYQRPQVNSAPVLNIRSLNGQKQDDLLSYNNWKKMNMSLNQMVNEQNPYQSHYQLQTQGKQNTEVAKDLMNQYQDINEDVVNEDVVNEDVVNEITEQEFLPNSNRAKYGTFISNNTSHNTINHGAIRSKNIPSYLAIRKAHNNESIYL